MQFFMTSSPSSFLKFSLLAIIFQTILNKITPRRFQQHLQKAPLCSGISFHLFTYSPIPQLSQYYRPSARSKSLRPCSVKTPQYWVCKCVHKSKSRVTNRSCVNPVTVQCKVGKWCIRLHSYCRLPRNWLRWVKVSYLRTATTSGLSLHYQSFWF